MFEIKDVIKRIDEYLKTHEEVVIAIDGKSGSGKSTLGKKLNEYYKGNLIHMDDYFLPFNLRSKERMEEIGGNVNYEKFYNDIILNLKQDLISEPYLCKTGKFKEKRIIKHSKVTIIEGSYSLHPYFKKYYDISIGLDISSEAQIERLKKREGDNLINFINKWIPLENKYFDGFKVLEKVDILLIS